MFNWPRVSEGQICLLGERGQPSEQEHEDRAETATSIQLKLSKYNHLLFFRNTFAKVLSLLLTAGYRPHWSSLRGSQFALCSSGSAYVCIKSYNSKFKVGFQRRGNAAQEEMVLRVHPRGHTYIYIYIYTFYCQSQSVFFAFVIL
jgi:hypothetical protein